MQFSNTAFRQFSTWRTSPETKFGERSSDAVQAYARVRAGHGKWRVLLSPENSFGERFWLQKVTRTCHRKNGTTSAQPESTPTPKPQLPRANRDPMIPPNQQLTRSDLRITCRVCRTKANVGNRLPSNRSTSTSHTDVLPGGPIHRPEATNCPTRHRV